MWQRFSEQSRTAILYAQAQAQARGSRDVDTEHFLLGLLLQPESAGGIILRGQGASLEAVAAFLPPLLPQPNGEEARLTKHAKRVLELTADTARRMGHRFIGTGHMAIALARFEPGTASSILRVFKATPEVLLARFDSLEPSLQAESPHPEPEEAPQNRTAQAPGSQGMGERIVTRLVKSLGGE